MSALARDLGINRTQFNRYLSGESFPRPDILARICAFFDVDARVLLEPVEQVLKDSPALSADYLQNFLGTSAVMVPEADFPSGFYQFSRRSFVRENEYVRGLTFVSRDKSSTLVKGYEPKMAMAMQGIPPSASAREYRGFVLRVDDGISLTVARRNGLTASFNHLNRVNSFENNYWVGYVARTVRENSASNRITRLVYEHLGNDWPRVMSVARSAGFCNFEDLVPFHQRLLQPDDPFR